MNNAAKAAFLSAGLLGCASENTAIPEKISAEQDASCGFTPFDEAYATFESEIDAALSGTANTPLLDISISSDNIALPDAANDLVPGDLDGLGFISYATDGSQNGFVTGYMSSDNGSNYFTDASAGTSCTDNTFAYNFTDRLLITGQCDWSGYSADSVGACRGNLYENCAYEDNRRSNYDCTLISSYENAIAKVEFAAIE